jgi:ABC-type multidrug transport system fused ATPase/permease subunit
MVPEGSTLAFVGPSGAGKTTMIDILLGVLEPQMGEVLISGKNPAEASRIWPGAIAYVPQDIAIAIGTIRENVSLGYPPEESQDERAWQALKLAQLDQVVEKLLGGLDSAVGDRGVRMSGGQRQRLGIARAMYTSPRLLILDEATSSLDGETEANISDSINAMKGNVTVLMIAHRLSTVRNADLVVYLEKGSVIATGSFESVRSEVPDFDRQAQLMGL